LDLRCGKIVEKLKNRKAALQRSILHLGLFAIFFALIYTLLFFAVWAFKGLVQDFSALAGNPGDIALLPSAIFALAASYTNIKRNTPYPVISMFLIFLGFWAIVFLGFSSINNNFDSLASPETILQEDQILQSSEHFFLFRQKDGQRFQGVISYAPPPKDHPRFSNYGGATLDRQNKRIVLSSDTEPLELDELQMKENRYFHPDFSWEGVFNDLQIISQTFYSILSIRWDYFLWYSGAFAIFWTSMSIIFLFNSWPLAKWIWVVVFMRIGLYLFSLGIFWAKPMIMRFFNSPFLAEIVTPTILLVIGLGLWSFWLLVRTTHFFKRGKANA
jgi:hypothetical protein